jgi:hypothetical protein
MKALKYIVSIVALTAALTLSARADFVEATAPFGGSFLFNDVANNDVTDFDGFVGANNPSAPTVHIHTTGATTTGSGFANIKPFGDELLTSVIFTPADDTLFSDFSFRGQLNDAAGGMVTLIVTDQFGNTSQFVFDNLGSNADFARQGITALAGTGETIASVELISDFKEVKQIRFSFAAGVPDGGLTVMLLGAALCGLGIARRYIMN